MSIGLDNVIAAQTILSHVDGEQGRLILRGFDLEALAGLESFEAVAARLWAGFGPHDWTGAELEAALGEARGAVFERVLPLLSAASDLTPVEGLRLLLSSLADASPIAPPVLVTAAVPVFVAALARVAAGQQPLPPDPALGQAADFLRMLRGGPARDVHVRALDTYLVTVIDHGLNASTFTARVIASTRAGMISSVVGGLCALKGPLHGGAPGPVLDMLDAIGTQENIEPWLDARIRAGERLMGFGHRIYRVRDPRADVLKRVAASLAGKIDAGSGGGSRIRFAEAVEAEALRLLARAKPGHRLDTNVEFFTALVLEALKLPRAIFTSVFALGRVAGWAAHVMEQEQAGRIIRPQSAYVGPWPKAAA